VQSSESRTVYMHPGSNGACIFVIGVFSGSVRSQPRWVRNYAGI